MAAYLNERYKNVINVFTNTGKEVEGTLVFADKCDKYFNLNLVWLEYRHLNQFGVVNFETASRNGEPFEDLIKHKGLPTARARICTRDLKIRTIDRYLASIGLAPKDYKMAVGIRFDEQHRIADKYYPLAQELHVTKQIILEWWKRQPFDLDVPEHLGNCDFCFEKSLRKRLMNVDHSGWWQQMEERYGDDSAPVFDVRNRLSVSQIREKRDLQRTQLDIEYGCFCKTT